MSEKTPFEPDVELLADYAEGLTSVATSARIETYLKGSEEARNMLEGIRWFLEQPDNNRDDLEAWLNGTLGKQEELLNAPDITTVPQKGTTTWWRWAAIAAIFIGSSWFFTLPSLEDEVLAAIEQPVSGPVVTRSSNDVLMTQVAEKWEAEDFAGVTELLKPYFTTDTFYNPFPGAGLYQGYAFLQEGDYKMAAGVLRFESEQDNFSKESAQWYYSLATFFMGNPVEAQNQWQGIANSEGHFYQEQARDLLD